MAKLQIYNTMTRKKEEFQSREPGRVGMYVCGPTVYDFLHIGNFRGAIFFNLVRNWFEEKGYQVTFVYNYTDVDDKIIQRANQDKVDSKAIAERYIAEFEKDYRSLGLRPHTHNPRVTGYIPQIIAIIEKLIANGKAYVVEGEVFYSVDSFSEYGKLSHKNIEELQVGIRVEIGSKKRNPLDFTLWKPAKPDEPHWSSPWGEGRPGWHIECSAMSHALLGESFDVHGGGIDLIFPHHENEIAQSEGASHKPMVRYWMHNNFINFAGEKMSKSLGNVMTARTFLEKFGPEILKYLILMAHYRSFTDFSDAQIQNAVRNLARVYSALSLAQKIHNTGVSSRPDEKYEAAVRQAEEQIGSSLDDDFNTPEVFARVFELIRLFNNQYRPGAKVTPELVHRADLLMRLVRKVGSWMALFQEEPQSFLRQLDDILLAERKLARADIDALITKRNEARDRKDFKASDELRAQLSEMGIAVQDSPEGTVWEVQK